MKYLSLFFLLIVSCGDGQYINNEFISYVENFEFEYNISVTSNISFSDDLNDKAGHCHRNKFWGVKEVTINSELWETYNEYQREVLIYHELGHCEFNRGHINDYTDSVCPESIMLDKVFSIYEIERCYIPNRNYYLDELGDY
jgi:hypothetical protein